MHLRVRAYSFMQSTTVGFWALGSWGEDVGSCCSLWLHGFGVEGFENSCGNCCAHKARCALKGSPPKELICIRRHREGE